jgi:hypothetical protein
MQLVGRTPIMSFYLLVMLFLALRLAGIAVVPGLAALVVALATSRSARSRWNERLDVAGCLWIVHELSRRTAVVLLSVSWGFVGAGLTSVVVHVLVVVLLVILNSVGPENEPDLDMTLMGVLYFGTLSLGFLAFFALAMSRLARWLKPRGHGEIVTAAPKNQPQSADDLDLR